MPTKTYTVKKETFFTKDEMTQLFKQAHQHCQGQVKPTVHRIGKRGRLVKTRPREEYLSCIKNYINEQVMRKAGA